jgi:hypothetical protein
MTLDELLLQKLAKWRPDSNPDTLDVVDPDSGWGVGLSAERVEEVGSRLQALTLTPMTTRSGINLQARAEQVAAQVTGLLEPLRVVEVDTERGTALLRSQEASQRDDKRLYYELLLQADGGCGLRRYQAWQEPGHRREAISFTMTHEALGKLVNDLVR